MLGQAAPPAIVEETVETVTALLAPVLLVMLVAIPGDTQAETRPLTLADIRIRDPFILPVPEEGRYYMYGTIESMDPASRRRFDTYFSKDLKEWFGPMVAFRPDETFWAQRNFWAPEVYHYQGRYYMFASFHADGRRRGTQVLVADRPRGPFKPISDGPVTPRDWDCLDGTLFIDDDGKPWMVFCHEWVQVKDGEMCALLLSPDLKEPVGEPVQLFRASEAPWVVNPGFLDGYITDGPFLHRAQTGELLMLWSSFGKSGYALGVARSASGEITGPWKQDPDPLFSADGGHAMLFTTFRGELMLALHQPNSHMNERAKLFGVRERAGRLTIRK